jgi:hypothetical protein
MNPEGDKILNLSTQRLATVIAPLVGQNFAQGQIGLMGFMLTLVAKEYERGADLRARENSDIRSLLGEIAPSIGDGALRARAEAAGKTRDESLRISKLNEANYALRSLLTEVHAHLEAQPNARDAERRIWALLQSIAANRLVSLAPG